MPNQRLDSAIVVTQALVIIGLLYWIIREAEANPFMRLWISQNLSPLAVVLNEAVLLIIVGTALTFALIWIFLPERKISPGPSQAMPSRRATLKPSSGKYELIVLRDPLETLQESRPFYETIEVRRFLIVVASAAQATSLWFITAASLRITDFPADSFAFARQLPFTYWWGLAAALALTAAGTLVRARLRIGVEIWGLFLLALYLVGLPSFVYENPRILDSYQHAGNSLGLLNNQGWVGAPIWYLRQFPGAYTFFAQLVSVAGIDPFGLSKYYTVGLSWTVTLFIYVIARAYGPNYSASASALFLGGIWFQLHLSPQSLALILYLGILFVTLKMTGDRYRARLWAALGIAGAVSLVASHPVTPLVIIAGCFAFLVLIGFLAPQLGPRKIAQNFVKLMDRARLTELMLVGQGIVVAGLLYGLYEQSQSNILFGIWVSQNFPFIALAVAAGLTVLGVITAVVVRMEMERRRIRSKPVLLTKAQTLFARLSNFWYFLTFFLAFTLGWWLTFASETRVMAENISERALLLGLSHLTREISSIPSTPASSYYLAITLDQAISATVWLLGTFLLVFLRRSSLSEFIIAGFFAGGVSTIPLALFAKTDVLQRSYLFALVPAVILLAWMMERKAIFLFRGRSLFSVLKVTLLLAVLCFSFLMPIARNGVDPFEYIPKSSLQASETAAGLVDHSILFIHPGEYGWRFYAALRGDNIGPRLEQPFMEALPGGFVKINSTLNEFDMNFTLADSSADYIMISDYYENLYVLRFGTQSGKYLYGKAYFEAETSRLFDLVYSTGTDHIYANRGLG